MVTPDNSPVTQGKRCRASDPHLAFVAEKGKVEKHAKWWEPEMQAPWDATHATLVGGS